MKNHKYQSGFTIVELIVVIAVIGVLAAITVVSYVGISNKAAIAPIKSDLFNASNQLKLFSVENGEFPTLNRCPDPGATEICLKNSPGNTYNYTRLTPQSFYLETTNNSDVWYITNNSQPSEVVVTPPIFATGGIISELNNNIIHTFGPGTSTIISTRDGSIAVNIRAGGGGEGAEYSYGGGNGGLSSISVDSGTPYLAYGGTGGDPWEEGLPGFYVGASGTTSPNGLTGLNGGALNGSTDTCAYAGGSGGRVYGNINILSGQSVVVTVGSGGLGAFYSGGYCTGSNGGAGSITISYAK